SDGRTQIVTSSLSGEAPISLIVEVPPADVCDRLDLGQPARPVARERRDIGYGRETVTF
ncbi:MAG: hypothetical protein JWO33_1323, partial [Caulobacteraceae bacterium]|nr:hypothetical protein [Caulobacteraceae bacterium]